MTRRILLLASGFALAAALASTAHAGTSIDKKEVECGNNGDEGIQKLVDDADKPTIIFIEGVCVEDVTIKTDDVTLSGNQAGDLCDKDNPGGTGTIEGTVTVDGVRASIEFLTITGARLGQDGRLLTLKIPNICI